MIIDAHAHLGKWYFPIDNVSPLQMTENMKRLGIDRTIVSHSLSLTYDFREGNRLLSKLSGIIRTKSLDIQLST